MKLSNLGRENKNGTDNFCPQFVMNVQSIILIITKPLEILRKKFSQSHGT
jgi:hypothetical protein